MNSVHSIERYAKHRDAEAFSEIVRDYQSMVLATCRRQVHVPGDVDDAVQETFLKLAKNAGSLRSNVAAWLHRCATNIAHDLNRRAATRQRHESSAATSERSTDAQRELAELREHLDAALDRLGEDDRELILQRFFVGQSQADIAQARGVSPARISQRMNEAIETLRRELAKSGMPAIGVGSAAGLTTLLQAEAASVQVSAALTAQLNAIGLSGVPKTSVVPAAKAFTVLGLNVFAFAGLVLAIGAVVAFVATAVVRPSSSSSAAAAGPTTVPAVSGITVTDTNDASAAAPNWQPPAGLARGALVGRITDAAGQPISGARVSVGDDSVVADADGVYVFNSVGAAGTYRVGVSADGFVAIEPYGQDRELQVRLTPDAQVLRSWVLQRAVTLRVAIDDQSTSPSDVDPNVTVFGVATGPRAFAPQIRSARKEGGVSIFYVRPSPTPYTVLATTKNCSTLR